MEIKELQKLASEIIERIDKKTGGKHDNETLFLHISEEIEEISRQLLNPKIKRDDTNIENLKEEIADVILLLSKLANNNNIDIEEAIKNKIEELKRRHNID